MNNQNENNQLGSPNHPQQIPNEPQQQEDPTIFLANQMLGIKESLEKEIADLRTMVTTSMAQSQKLQPEIESIKQMITDALKG